MRRSLVDALATAYTRIGEVAGGLADADFARPTRAAAWTVQELLFHLTLDATRAMAAFATTTDAEPDVDAVTYWRPFRPSEGDGGAAHARFVQVSASAFARGSGVADWWTVVSTGAAGAAGAAHPDARVRTQGHVLTARDLVSTLLVEATVHHLDLVVDLPADVAGPVPAGLAETRRVLEGLLGAALPAGWDATDAVLKGTGRLALTDADHTALGDRATAIALLG